MRATAALALALVTACGGAAVTGPATPATRDPEKVTPPAPPPVEVMGSQLHGPVKTVSITGGENLDYLRLQPLFEDEIGKPLDPTRLRAKLDTAMADQTLADLVLRGEQLADGVHLVVLLTPQPKVVSLVIRDATGAPRPVPAELAAAVGQRLAPVALDATVAALREGYENEGAVGFAAAWTAVKSGAGVAVTLAENPGERLTIAARTFAGAKQIKAAALETLLAKDLPLGTPWLVDRIQRAALVLEAYYWDHGFAEVKIAVAPPPEHAPATLTFNIVEGPLYHLSKIELTGVPAADAKRLLALGQLRSGALFNRSEIATARDKISSALVAAHPKVNVLPLTKVDAVKHTVALDFEIHLDGGT